MSKVFNTKLNKSIIATILVVVFTVTIILIPFNTVYAAEDNGVVVTDTEISFDGYTIPRMQLSNLPFYGQYGISPLSDRLSVFFGDYVESDISYYCYFYIPSKNVVVYCPYLIYSFVINGFVTTFSSGYLTFYVYDLNSNSVSTLSWSYSHSPSDLNSSYFNHFALVYKGSGSFFSYSSYRVESYSSVLFFDGVNLLTDIEILYANYRINGFYEPDDSAYDLPDSILSYQYLFYRPEHGYVFIDSGEKLSDLNTSLTNVNNSGSFTSSFWIHWSQDFNKLVYKSIDGVSWDLLNGSSVYGSSYNTSDSLVCDVLGISSSDSVWSYFQDSPNIPDDLVMTEFSSGDPIGQTIDFDSGSGTYISHTDLVSFDGSIDRLYAFIGADSLYYVDNLISILNTQLFSDKIYLFEARLSSSDNVIGQTRFGISLEPFEVGDQVIYRHYGHDVINDGVSLYIEPFVIKESTFVVSDISVYPTLNYRLSNIGDNIDIFDSNVQTGFSNLTDQVHSLFDSSELGNSHLFNILNKLDDIIDKPDLDLSGVVEKLDQIISSLGSGSSDLLPADDSNSPLNPLYDKLTTLVNGLGFNNAEGVGILALLTSIAENVGDIADSLDDDQSGQVGSAIASFGSSSASLAALFGTLGAGIASFSGGFTLFSGSASAFYNSLPSGVKLLVIVAPTFMLASGVMYGARKIYGG